jgi:hypothetical protein
MLQAPATYILFGIALNYFLNELRERSIFRSLIWVLVFFQLVILFVGTQQNSSNGLYKVPSKKDYAQLNRLLSYVKTAEGDVLCGQFISLAMLSGKKVWLGAHDSLEFMFMDGRFDPTEVVNKIEKMEFSLILGPPPKIPAISEAVHRNYAAVDTLSFNTQYAFWKATVTVMKPLPSVNPLHSLGR